METSYRLRSETPQRFMEEVDRKGTQLRPRRDRSKVSALPPQPRSSHLAPHLSL